MLCYTIVNDNAKPNSKHALELLCRHFMLDVELLPTSVDSALNQINKLPLTMSMTRLTKKATTDALSGDVTTINLNSECNPGLQVWPAIRSATRVPKGLHSMWIGSRGSIANYKVLVFKNVPARVVLQAGRDSDGHCFLQLLTPELKQIECSNIPLEGECTWGEVFATMYEFLRRDQYWQHTDVSILGPFLDPTITEAVQYSVNLNTIKNEDKVEDMLILPPSSEAMREQWDKKSNDFVKSFLETMRYDSAPALKKRKKHKA